jgi:hypothetical protein
LLQHDLRALQIEVSETVFDALVSEGKTQLFNPKIQTVAEVGHYEFWNQGVTGKHTIPFAVALRAHAHPDHGFFGPRRIPRDVVEVAQYPATTLL